MIYTFIVNYRGGAYISRFSATAVMAATQLWAERLAQGADIKDLDNDAFRKAYAEDMEEFPPAEIDGCPNVWFMFFFSG